MMTSDALLIAVVTHLNAAGLRALANALYDAASREHDDADRAESLATTSDQRRAAYNWHRQRAQHLRDHARYVDRLATLAENTTQ